MHDGDCVTALALHLQVIAILNNSGSVVWRRRARQAQEGLVDVREIATAACAFAAILTNGTVIACLPHG